MKTSKRQYSNIKYDVLSSIVVFLVALPLCLGIAQATGASPLAGLISGIIGGILVTLLSPSPLSVSGPAAGLIALVISGLAMPGGMSALLVAVFLAGMLQVLAGILRIGRLAGLIPGTVVRGLLAGIGLLLIVQQIPVAIGYVSDSPPDAVFSPHLVQDITPGAVLIVASSLILLLLTDMPVYKNSMFAIVPAPLIVVLWGIAVQYLLSITNAPVIPSSQLVRLPELALKDLYNQIRPDWAALLQPATYKLAFSIALIASLETLLSLEATSRIDPEKRAPHSDKELLAQGAGNMVSGFLGGLPLTAVIVRSSSNIYAGAKTRLSSFLHGIWLLLSTLFLVSILNMIPLSSLSAILIFTGYKLASPGLFIGHWRLGWSSFIPFFVTVIGIATIGMLEGIALGGVIQLLFSIAASEKKSLSLTNKDNVWLLNINQNVTFISKPQLCKMLDSIPDNADLYLETANGVSLAPDLLEALSGFLLGMDQRRLTVHVSEQLQQQLKTGKYVSLSH